VKQLQLFFNKIPIAGVAGDQAALSIIQTWNGQKHLWNRLLYVNEWKKPVYSNNNLLTTVAWKSTAKNNALEGSVWSSGTMVAIGKMIDSAEEIET
jgi:glycerol kinase